MNKIQAMELASGLTRLITGMEDELLQNIAAYLLAGKVDSSTSKWKIRKLAELGKLHQKNIETVTSYVKEQRELAELTVKLAAVDAMQDTERGFRKAVIAGLVTDAADGTMDSTMNAIIGTLMKQAKNDLNIVNTTMLYKARDAAGKAVRDAAQLANKQEFVDMLNKAAGQVVTNTETMTAAVSKCLKDMANKGIPAFVDRGGREWSPEAYVGLCVRQTAMNTGTTALFERMKDYHTHFIEISSHLGARPKCSRDQGRIFDLDNTSGYIEDGRGNTIEYAPWSSSSYGQPDGILGINCKHSAFPFTPGSSLQTYFPYDQEENDKRYKEIQKQRELERNVRAAKRECAMLKNGDPEEFKKASVRLKERTAQLKQYCSEHDLTYMNERTSVLGYSHSEASKVTAAYRKALQNEQLTLDNISKNYAKSIGAFNFYDIKDDSPITAQGVIDELKASNIGRLTLDVAEDLPEGIRFTYGEYESGNRGSEYNGVINIYLNNCTNTKVAAQTVIHECTHYRYGIGQSVWSECVCYSQELKHSKNKETLTISEKRDIIKKVKEAYPDLNWRKGGIIGGRQRSH